MRKQYLSAPLPFQGQKRRFAKSFIKVLHHYPDRVTFVDLFGGSGLLSHITKCQKPEATVIYNDFDNYRKRIENIPRTNALLADFRKLAEGLSRIKPIPIDVRERIYERIEQEEHANEYVDYITISSSLLFSMKYKLNLDELRKETMYNNIRCADFPLCEDYLDGLEITSCDYKVLYNKYKDDQNVVFIVDPPYLSTQVGTYKMYWGMEDYLDVLNVLKSHSFVYFTSNKSSIVPLCEWMGRNKDLGNPFDNCKRLEFNAHMNYNSSYTDMMLFKNAT